MPEPGRKILKTYQRNAIEVEAMQVKRPFHNVSRAFPRSHQTDRPSGKLHYIRLIDAPEGSNRAHEGDWIIRYPSGKVEVITDGEFEEQFEETSGEA